MVNLKYSDGNLAHLKNGYLKNGYWMKLFSEGEKT